MRNFFAVLILLICPVAMGQATSQPSTQPSGKLEHISVDVKKKEVRVECHSVIADYPLEFLAVETNTNEYEALVRTDAKPSNVHLALLMIGLKPGQPLHYSQAEDKWYPPTGPLVRLWFEYDQNGKHKRVPAYEWMRDITTKKPPEDYLWCFTGSRFLDSGQYGADATGQLVGIVNNELTILDVPALKSRAMDSRQWERNIDVMPPTNTPVTLVITPASDKDAATTEPATQPSGH